MTILRPRGWISFLRRHILRMRRFSYLSTCSLWTNEARPDTCGMSARVDRMPMILACDRELRWEEVSAPMKIQVRVGPSRIAGQGSPRHHFVYTSAESRRLYWVGVRPKISRNCLGRVQSM